MRARSIPGNPNAKIADKATAWSAPGLGDFTSKAWGDLTDAEKRAIAAHFLYAASMPPAAFGDLSLPHHRASDGAAVYRGVAAAAGRLSQANIPAGEMAAAKAHLRAHYAQFGETPPDSLRAEPGEQLIELPPLMLRAAVAPGSLNEEARTVNVIFSTGAGVERRDWVTGQKYLEVLSLKPSHVRLDRLNDGAPFLNAHGSGGLFSGGPSLEDVIGTIVPGTAEVSRGQGRATVRFSKRASVEPIWQDVRDGILRNISVGYRTYKQERTPPPSERDLEIRTATDWEPYEISAVPMGADAGAQVRDAGSPQQTNPCVIVIRGTEEMPMNPDDTNVLDLNLPSTDGTRVPPVADPADPGAPLRAVPEERPGVMRTEHQVGIEAERARVVGINKAVRNAGFDQSLADRLIAQGVSLEQAQATVLDELGKLERAAGPGPNAGRGLIRDADGGVRVYGGQDLAVNHMRSAIENAMLHRMAPQFFPLDESGRAYAGSTMLDFARYTLQGHGVRITGLSKMEVIGWALELKQRTGMHTTSDFANILADVANKTLRRAYDEAPQTFAPITARADLQDFKPVRRVQLGEAPELQTVNEHGEFTHGTIGDAKEQYQLATFGRMFSISRQALVNDDTNAFSRLAIMFGRMARHKESDLVWAQITDNPAMGDTVNLFHATHGNLAGSGTAIDVTNIGAGRAAMRQQTGLSGVEKLNIMPRYLIVPTTKETIADQFVSQNLLASQSSAVNPFAGKLTVISEPRLDSDSTTAWYLAASTDQIDIIELGFLAGENGPVVESKVGWEVDGLEVKVRHDVAAKVLDWRGLFKNPGA